jgi:hypothetical protein
MGSADRTEVSSISLFLVILLGFSGSATEGTGDAMTRLDSEKVCCSLMLSMCVWSYFTSKLLGWGWISLSYRRGMTSEQIVDHVESGISLFWLHPLYPQDLLWRLIALIAKHISDRRFTPTITSLKATELLPRYLPVLVCTRRHPADLDISDSYFGPSLR